VEKESEPIVAGSSGMGGGSSVKSAGKNGTKGGPKPTLPKSKDPATAATTTLHELTGGAKFVIVAGKGGVGKTTVAASLARMAANTGARVLVVDTEGKRGIASAFGVSSLGYAEITLSAGSAAPGRGQIAGRTVTPDDALVEWLGDHGLGLLAKRMSSSGLVDVIATATPGIRDLLVLAKVKQLVLEGGFDLVIMDTPASGHALTFLTSPKGLIEAVRSGPIRRQSEDVMAVLTNAALTRVILVTLAEETPMAELTETAYALEDRVGVALGPIVVNGLLPPVPAPPWPGLADTTSLAMFEAIQFEYDRFTAQQSQVAALSQRLPLPQVHLPLLACPAIGPQELTLLATELRLVAAPTGSPTAPSAPSSAQKTSSRDKGSSSAVASFRSAPTQGEVPADPATGAGRLALGIAAALENRSIVLVCGPGGVGKTTTAAALGLAYARRGKRVAVVTIDPAKRLADALGLGDGLRNTPTRVDLRAISGGASSDAVGELWALMLDTKATFDGLVRQYAPNAAQADKILANPFYRNISGAMGGTQEYMATEKLHELVCAPIDGSGQAMAPFDVVIVDTPPSRHALDFVAAPERLTRLLDNRVFRTLMAPAKRGFRVMGLATEGVLRGVGKVIGGEVLADAVAFFQAFEGMEAGFRSRAVAVSSLLRADSTAWVLVSAPTPEAVEEGLLLKAALTDSSIELAAIIANRVQPQVPDWPSLSVDSKPSPTDSPEPTTQIDLALREARLRFSQHQRALAPLLSTSLVETKVASKPMQKVALIAHVLIPQRSADVHDLESLTNIAQLLLP
jgi:anion-transporting  ArsA/GET3 family ATPase